MVVSKKNAVSSFVVMVAVVAAGGCADDGVVTDEIHIPLCIPGGAHGEEVPVHEQDAAMHMEHDAAMHMEHDAAMHMEHDAAMHMSHDAGMEDAAMHTEHDADEHSGHMTESDAGEHGHSTCGLQENCKDVLTLAEGLVVDGMDGMFSVEVVSHNTLADDHNHWMVKILDADGEQVTDVTVRFSTWSNDCMHGGPTAPETVNANDKGLYMLMPVAAHGGPWEVRLVVSDSH